MWSFWHHPRPGFVLALMNTQWFRARLQDFKLSQRKLAFMLGIDPAAASLLLRGRRRMTTREAHQISTILGVPLLEVMRQAGIDVTEDMHRCAVAAFVDENGLITTLGQGTHDVVLRPGDCPVGAFAIQVRCHACGQDGYLLFVSPAQLPAESNLDKLCMAVTAEGKQLVATVRRGYKTGFNNLLLWPSNRMLTDIEVAWTSSVLWIKPRT